MNRILIALLAAGFGLSGTTAGAVALEAAAVWLDPVSLQTSPGGQITIDLRMDATIETDATAAGGANTVQGELLLSFDKNLASYGDFTFLDGAPFDISQPVVDNSDPVNTVVSLFFKEAAPVSTIGRFSFTAAAGLAAGTNIAFTLADRFPLFGSFATELPSYQPFMNPPVISGTTVNVVPLPAAGWLLLSALGIAGWVRRFRVSC